jgi:hypothetical protein
MAMRRSAPPGSRVCDPRKERLDFEREWLCSMRDESDRTANRKHRQADQQTCHHFLHRHALYSLNRRIFMVLPPFTQGFVTRSISIS